MNALQPTRGRALAFPIFLTVFLLATTSGAQSPAVADATFSGPVLEPLSRRGVVATHSSSAPGGAGGRFDTFQVAGIPAEQPLGYPIHVLVRGARTTVMLAVRSARDNSRQPVVRARRLPVYSAWTARWASRGKEDRR